MLQSHNLKIRIKNQLFNREFEQINGHDNNRQASHEATSDPGDTF